MLGRTVRKFPVGQRWVVVLKAPLLAQAAPRVLRQPRQAMNLALGHDLGTSVQLVDLLFRPRQAFRLIKQLCSDTAIAADECP